jgi:very-short-patch-repair endonuclease
MWQCDQLHTWMATLTNVKNHKSWCNVCAGHAKWTIPELDEIAIRNGGRCLSTEYINSQSHLEWECAMSHRWSATPNSIVQGSWCCLCSSSRGEREISIWLKDHNIEFRPQYSFPGSRYSYDFYIPSTGWIVEFDGLQHFKEVPFFHHKYSFEHRQNIDREKVIMAYNTGLTMLRIHYHDFKKIGDFMQLVLTKSIPQVVCSRTDDYDYLGLQFPSDSAKTENNRKPLSLHVLTQNSPVINSPIISQQTSLMISDQKRSDQEAQNISTDFVHDNPKRGTENIFSMEIPQESIIVPKLQTLTIGNVLPSQQNSSVHPKQLTLKLAIQNPQICLGKHANEQTLQNISSNHA